MARKKILLLGGTQFIGRHVVPALLQQGFDVTLLNRGKTGPDLYPDLPRIHLDRQSEELERSSALKQNWDAVIDLSAYFPYEVERLLAILNGRCGRYIYCSTISAYEATNGAERMSLLREEDRLKDCTPEQAVDLSMATYGERKAECERVALRQSVGGIPVVILRPSVVYGAHDHTDRFAYWISRVDRNEPFLLPEGGLTITRRTYAPDLAAAFVATVDAPNVLGRAYNIADIESLSLRDTLETMGRHLGRKPLEKAIDVDVAWLEKIGVKPWVDLPLWIPRTHLMIDVFKARRDFNFSSTSVYKATADAADAFIGEKREPRAGLSWAKEREILAHRV